MGLRETAKGRCSNRPFFCALIQLSGNHNLIVQFCKGFFLFGFLNLVVNVHRGLNVRVSHDCHNQLDVVFHFTKARTECVSEVVNGKVSDNNRGTAFFFCLFCFFGVGFRRDTNDRPVYIMGKRNVSIAIDEHEVGITIDF